MENNCTQSLLCCNTTWFHRRRQNEPLMQVIENFCIRAGIKWRGGVGIGGGVMLNVTRIIFMVLAAVFSIQLIIIGVQTGNYLHTGVLLTFLKNAGLLLFFNAGALFFLIRMGTAISRGGFFGKHYTRALIPSFIFIPFANLFFIIISLFKGGLFRGWLAKK